MFAVAACVAKLFVAVEPWINTDERWITGSLLGCQRATLAPFTSALARAKHQWQGLPTINDLLHKDQKAFSVFRVTIDLCQPPFAPLLRPSYILVSPHKGIPHKNLDPNNGGYKLNEKCRALRYSDHRGVRHCVYAMQSVMSKYKHLRQNRQLKYPSLEILKDKSCLAVSTISLKHSWMWISSTSLPANQINCHQFTKRNIQLYCFELDQRGKKRNKIDYSKQPRALLVYYCRMTYSQICIYTYIHTTYLK